MAHHGRELLLNQYLRLKRALQQLGLVIFVRIDRMHFVKTIYVTPGVCSSKQTCEIKLLNSIQTATV